MVQTPNITAERSSNSCIIHIFHNLNVPCVRRIEYCFRHNASDPICEGRTDTQPHVKLFSLDTKLVNVTITYDIIYASEKFQLSVEPCREESKLCIGEDREVEKADKSKRPTECTAL